MGKSEIYFVSNVSIASQRLYAVCMLYVVETAECGVVLYV